MIFQTLEDDEVSRSLTRKLTKHEFDVAETIYAAADENGHELHILARGVAKVSVPKDGGEIELRRLAPGDSIGQSGILAGVRTDVIVRALTRATVFRLDKAALTPILARRPEVAHGDVPFAFRTSRNRKDAACIAGECRRDVRRFAAMDSRRRTAHS